MEFLLVAITPRSTLVVIPVKGPIYGLNRYLYSAALRLYPFIEKAMEVNPEYKSGVESLRRLDVCGGFLPATPAAKLIPKQGTLSYLLHLWTGM